MDAFLGEIRILPFSFPPRNWISCDGALLPISQNTALYSIISTIYGGDGRLTMAAPDLRGRAPRGTGSGPGVTYSRLGGYAGVDRVRLNPTETPEHTHQITHVQTKVSNTAIPNGAFMSKMNGNKFYKNSLDSPGLMSDSSIQETGGDQPHENRQPYLAMNYCMSIDGIYPPRN